MALLKLHGINFSDQQALEVKDTNTMYFIQDKNCIYVKEKLYGGRIELVDTDPESPESGVVYINRSTLECKFYNQETPVVIAKGFTTTISDSPNDNLLPTAKAVSDFVTKKIADISGGSGVFVTEITATGDGNLSISKGSKKSTVPLTNMVLNPQWQQETMQLTLPIVGGESLVIDLSKDLVVTAGKYVEDSNEIWLTIAEDKSYEDTEKLIKIPVAGLIDIYTGKETNSASVTVSPDKKVSVNVKVSNKEGNTAVIDIENGGIYVPKTDISNKSDKVGAGHDNEILTAGADGNMQASGKTIGGSTLAGAPNENTIATEAAVKTYADSVGQAAKQAAAEDATQKANTAEQNAKTYADGLISWTGW